jgi:hypothetical protein
MPPYTAKVLKDSDLADIHAFLKTIPKLPDPRAFLTQGLFLTVAAVYGRVNNLNERS